MLNTNEYKKGFDDGYKASVNDAQVDYTKIFTVLPIENSGETYLDGYNRGYQVGAYNRLISNTDARHSDSLMDSLTNSNEFMRGFGNGVSMGNKGESLSYKGMASLKSFLHGKNSSETYCNGLKQGYLLGVVQRLNSVKGGVSTSLKDMLLNSNEMGRGIEEGYRDALAGKSKSFSMSGKILFHGKNSEVTYLDGYNQGYFMGKVKQKNEGIRSPEMSVVATVADVLFNSSGYNNGFDDGYKDASESRNKSYSGMASVKSALHGKNTMDTYCDGYNDGYAVGISMRLSKGEKSPEQNVFSRMLEIVFNSNDYKKGAEDGDRDAAAGKKKSYAGMMSAKSFLHGSDTMDSYAEGYNSGYENRMAQSSSDGKVMSADKKIFTNKSTIGMTTKGMTIEDNIKVLESLKKALLLEKDQLEKSLKQQRSDLNTCKDGMFYNTYQMLTSKLEAKQNMVSKLVRLIEGEESLTSRIIKELNVIKGIQK